MLEEHVYDDLPSKLKGKVYSSMVNGIQKDFRVIGGRDEFLKTANSNCVYGHLNSNGEWEFDTNNMSFCLSVRQSGPYNGTNSSMQKTLEQLLEPFRQEIMRIRNQQ